MGLVVKSILKWRRIAPRVAKIILGTGAERGREFFAIHKEFFVTFTPPAAARIPHMQHHAHKTPGPGRLEQRPVNAP